MILPFLKPKKVNPMTAVDDVKKSVDTIAVKAAVVKEKTDALVKAHEEFHAAVVDMMSVATPPQ